MSVRTVLTPILFVLIVVLATSTWSWGYSDRIIAIVNKDVITLSELKQEVRDEHIRMKARYEGEELKQRMANKEFQVLNTLIEERLQLQEAESGGFTVTEEELDKALQQSPPQTQFDDVSEAELTKQMKKRILLQKIRMFEVRRVVTISDTEISQYYKDHPQQFMVSPTYHLRQILLLVDSNEDKDHKHDQARAVFDRLKAGEDFKELALQFSGGPEASEGGMLGLLKQDELLTPIAKALEGMQPGKVSAPIETALGYHIIALDDITPKTLKPIDEVEDQIKNLLRKERSDDVFQHWLSDLKKKAFIEIKYSPQSSS